MDIAIPVDDPLNPLPELPTESAPLTEDIIFSEHEVVEAERTTQVSQPIPLAVGSETSFVGTLAPLL